jgi:endonuclease III
MVSKVIEKASPKAKPAAVAAIFAAFQAANPHPTTELNYGNDFQLLLAVLLSAQTTDVAVNRATATFFKKIKTPAALVAFGAENLKQAIRTIGLYQTKARNALAMAQLLVTEHGGRVPHDIAALVKLPGVGLKTASVVANTLWGAPLVAVDTHVFRVSRRLGLSKAATPEKMAPELPKVIPAAFIKDAHHWLILHGRYTCTARAPKCGQCPVDNLCHSRVKVVINP